MKHPLKGRWLLAGVALAFALPVSLRAQSTPLSFTPLEYDGVSNFSDLEDIVINGSLVTQGSDLILAIRNNSVASDDWVTSDGPTITRIYFDGNGLLGNPQVVSTTGYVVMHRDGTMNLPGGNATGFATDFGYTANPPLAKWGIDPGEALVLKFLNTPIEAFTGPSGARIGLHIQQIGDNFEDSASFTNITVVPEPAALSLVVLGGLALLRRRRS